MASFAKLVSIFFFFFFSFLPPKPTAQSCPTTYCSSSEKSLPVKFPFRLTSRNQDPRCGYPGFNLSCKNGNPTISLPSGEFVVRLINYGSQVLKIDDPQSCLPKHFLFGNFNVVGTPFRVESFQSFTFLNCSNTTGDEMVSISCLSGSNFTVKAIPTMIFTSLPPSCLVISEALVPVSTLSQRWLDNWQLYLDANIVFEWDEPYCYDCERRGGDCGFKSDTGLELDCFNAPKKGIPKGVYYIFYAIGGIGILVFTVLYTRNQQPTNTAPLNQSRNPQFLAANREPLNLSRNPQFLAANREPLNLSRNPQILAANRESLNLARNQQLLLANRESSNLSRNQQLLLANRESSNLSRNQQLLLANRESLNLSRNQLLWANREFSSGRITINRNSASIVSKGLDDTVIGSYPKTLVGESSRLSDPSDNICSICLSEYKAKEVLRTIPDCGHYFHDDCIVKWLKLNATCPLCRNLPQRPTK